MKYEHISIYVAIRMEQMTYSAKYCVFYWCNASVQVYQAVKIRALKLQEIMEAIYKGTFNKGFRMSLRTRPLKSDKREIIVHVSITRISSGRFLLGACNC